VNSAAPYGIEPEGVNPLDDRLIPDPPPVALVGVQLSAY